MRPAIRITIIRLLAAIGIVAAAACARNDAARASLITDDFGDTLVLRARPARIVSLNPTTTEILFAIGAGSRLVGRTTYDMWPAEARAVPDLGPGLRPNVEAVLAARPDLVILYASDDNREAARRLRAAGITTAAYRVNRIAEFARATRALGLITGDSIAARMTVDSVQATLDRIRSATASRPRPTVFWPLWDSPLLAVGGGSFLHELIEIAGGRNIYGDLAQPSPQIAFEDLLHRDPDIILAGPNSRARYLSDPRWRALRAVREGRVMVVDTNLVLRPATRMGEGAASLGHLLHPDVVR